MSLIDYPIQIYDSNGQPDTANHEVLAIPSDGSGNITAEQIGSSHLWKFIGVDTSKLYEVTVEGNQWTAIIPDITNLSTHLQGHGSGVGAEAGMIALADLVDAVIARIFTSSTIQAQVEGLNNGGVVANDKVENASILDGAVDVNKLVAAVIARMFTGSTVKTQVEGLNNGGVVANDKVVNASILNTAITTNKINPGAVTSDKIALLTITDVNCAAALVARFFSTGDKQTQIEAAFDVDGKVANNKIAALETKRPAIVFEHVQNYNRSYDNCAPIIIMDDENVNAARGGYFKIPAPIDWSSGSFELEIAFLSPGDSNDVVFKLEYKFSDDGDSTTPEATDSVTKTVPNLSTEVDFATITLSDSDQGLHTEKEFLIGRLYRGLAADGDTTVGDIKVIGIFLRYIGRVEAN